MIDLRPAPEAAAGHIARTVSLPLADLETAKGKFPANRSAPIILYGNGDEAVQARKVIKEWGFNKVALVNGGLSGWQARGGALDKNPAASEIHWVRSKVEGEVPLAEFSQVVAANPPG